MGDITLKVGDESVTANREILCIWSKVFQVMLSAGMREQHTNVVEIHDFTMEEVKVILEKLYPPCTAPITNENLQLFLRFSEQYDVEEIRRQCEDFITRARPSMHMTLLAEQYRLSSALDSLIKWMAEDECPGEEETLWQQLSFETRYFVRELQIKKVMPAYKIQSTKLKMTEDRLSRLMNRAREIEEHNRKTRDDLLELLRSSKMDYHQQARMESKVNSLQTFRGIY